MRVISSSSIKFVMGQIKTKTWHGDIVFEVTPVVVKQIIPLKAKDLTAANSFRLMLLKKIITFLSSVSVPELDVMGGAGAGF